MGAYRQARLRPLRQNIFLFFILLPEQSIQTSAMLSYAMLDLPCCTLFGGANAIPIPDLQTPCYNANLPRNATDILHAK